MKHRIVIALLLSSLAFTGCRALLGEGTGSLTIQIGSTPSASARTIVSDLDTTIASYHIHGTDGVSEFSHTLGADETVVTQAHLVAGRWTITAEAVNTAGEAVLGGAASVLVQPGATATAQVVLSPPAGNGAFSFVLTWPSEHVESPETRASVVPQGGGTSTSLDFTVDPAAGSASFTGDLAAGFYEFTIALRDGALIVWPGTTRALQIRAGATSSDALALNTGDLRLSGPGPGNGTPGELIWSFVAGSAFSSSIWSSPAIQGDRFYVGSDTGRLYALDLATGDMMWNFLTDGRVTSTPALGTDGTVFVGSHDGNVYAIDPNGSQLWAYPTGGWVRSSPAIGPDGTVYVGSNDGFLYALNPTTGAAEWSFDAGSDITSSPSVGSDGTVYFGTYSGDVHARWPDGSQRWVFTGAGDWVHSSPAIGSDGTVYVGSYDGFLYALDGADGSVVWSYDAGDWVGSSASIASGRVYTGTRDGTLHAVDAATGVGIWTFAAGTGGVYSTPVVGDDGVIYVGSYDRNIYAVNPDGTEQWRYETGLGGVSSSPAMDTDGVVYVGSRDGNLYALGTSSGGLESSSWPMFGRDPRRASAAE